MTPTKNIAAQGKVKITLHTEAKPDLGALLQDRQLTSKHCLANSMKWHIWREKTKMK